MIGKINDDLFSRIILPNKGALSPDVIVGPKMGMDGAVVKIGEYFMVIAEDPIFPSPTMSPEDFGWITVHIGASDVAVMGVLPKYMSYSLLLPPDTEEDYIERLVKSIDKYASELGISIVGGHTGYYGAVTIPTIGGITVLGTGKKFITPAGAQVGDAIVITKGAAIEAAALLACELGEKIKKSGVDRKLVERAGKRLKEISVVKDAVLASEINGVHAMHDATEGGVCRGLWEIARASNTGIRIERKAVPLPPDIKEICGYFNLNPYEVISEGTLLITCSPDTVELLLKKFKEERIAAALIGQVVPAEKGCYWVENNGEKTELLPPEIDRFWDVFFNALLFKNDSISNAEKILCDELGRAVDNLKKVLAASLVPEVGSNIAYALPDAGKLEEIAAIPGRMLRFKGKVAVLGEPEMGCSKYMGGALLAVRKHFPEMRCIINLSNNEVIRNICRKLNYKIASMPVPADYRQTDADFYKDLNLILSSRDSSPQIIEIPDRINLESLIMVAGETLDDLVSIVKKISDELKKTL
jgi:hydrogenase maturation factor/predicted fused transcriptional regulator/phosphomethylpyrimidine kinase